MTDTDHDPVNHPAHYTSHPSGVECIQVVEHMGFNLGNAIKYIWRADEKGNAIEDLRKAAWYVQREIDKRERERGIREFVEFDPATGKERPIEDAWAGPHSLACANMAHLHGSNCHAACPTCGGFEYSWVYGEER